jgi:hypothetical protein
MGRKFPGFPEELLTGTQYKYVGLKSLRDLD